MAAGLIRFVEKSRKILGVGANYRDLIAAWGLPTPTEPMVFMKPLSAYITQGTPIKVR
ncbi:oxaloacetate decarboxylase, mitochondrial-like [Saccoglossus kowalevskii]